MLAGLKGLLKNIPGVVFLWDKTQWIRDIGSSCLPQGRPLLTPFGFVMAGSRSAVHREMQRGAFEPLEVSLIKDKLASEFDVFVDIGANIGYFSLITRHAGKHVVAIEPQPSNVRYLCHNCCANDWTDVEVFPVGLSDNPSIAILYGISSTGASIIPGWAGNPKAFKTVIPLSTLDIVLSSRFAGKRLFIKLDAEGVEYKILNGAKDTLKREPRPIWMVEITGGQFFPERRNPFLFQTFEMFARHGYRAMDIGANCAQVTESDLHKLVDLKSTGAYNFLFR